MTTPGTIPPVTQPLFHSITTPVPHFDKAHIAKIAAFKMLQKFLQEQKTLPETIHIKKIKRIIAKSLLYQADENAVKHIVVKALLLAHDMSEQPARTITLIEKTLYELIFSLSIPFTIDNATPFHNKLIFGITMTYAWIQRIINEEHETTSPTVFLLRFSEVAKDALKNRNNIGFVIASANEILDLAQTALAQEKIKEIKTGRSLLSIELQKLCEWVVENGSQITPPTSSPHAVLTM